MRAAGPAVASVAKGLHTRDNYISHFMFGATKSGGYRTADEGSGQQIHTTEEGST